MCSVSMIGDEWARRVPPQHLWVQPYLQPMPPLGPNQTRPLEPVDRAEFDALKREVEALRELLKAAKKYDAATGQPDCEVEDKVALIKRLADLVGVDMGEVFPAQGIEAGTAETGTGSVHESPVGAADAPVTPCSTTKA